MVTLGVEKTSFTLDVIGRCTCNTDGEALAAIGRPDARPFDVIVIGGGSFGPILAENVYSRPAGQQPHRVADSPGFPHRFP